MRILLIGGSKSGKSRTAQELCRRLGGSLYYWATMEPADAEDRLRIEKHVSERAGWGFTTIERGRDLLHAPCLPSPDGTVLFDSVTALLANEMFAAAVPDDDAPRRVTEELLTLSRRCRHFVCVCDDLWRDGMAYDDATQAYCRALAEICRALAAEFDTVCEASGGLIRARKGERPV